MSVCLQPLTFYAYADSTGINRYAYETYVPAPGQPLDSCAYVLASNSELAGAYPEFLRLTVEESVQIAIAIIGLWAVAWVFRVLSREIRSHGNDGD